jgi:hypothetical protein
MADEYQPTKREVLSEIWNGVRSKFTRENTSNVGKSLKDFVGMYAVGTAFMVGMPYAIPTYARGFKNHENSDYDLEMNAQIVGEIGGIVTGVVADIGQVVGYGYAVKEDHPEFLLIPVATNIASGVYEIGRKMYNNARQRVLDKHKSESLEATLETAEPAQE